MTRRVRLTVVAPAATVLAQAAQSLSPGQSVRLQTSLPWQLLYAIDPIPSGTGAYLTYANSAVYDPIRREVRYLGKKAGAGQYTHWLIYDEATNTWTKDSRATWTTAVSGEGHGYDHNAVNPATGDHYYREYNQKYVHVWNAATNTWVDTPTTGFTSNIINGGLQYVPGYGLVYGDGSGLYRITGGTGPNFAGSSWVKVHTGSSGSNHCIAEYSASTRTLLIVSSVATAIYWKFVFSVDFTSFAQSSIAAPPFAISAATNNGKLCSVPATGKFIAYEHTGEYRWAEYDLNTDVWTIKDARAIGLDPYTVANGLPRFGRVNNNPVICTPIDEHGVVMFIKEDGQTLDGEVWLYKHS